MSEQRKLGVFALSVGPRCHCGTVLVGWMCWKRSKGEGEGGKVRLMRSVGCGKHLQTARQREGAVRKECEVFVEVFVGS